MPYLTYLSNAWNMFFRALRVKFRGFKRYSGNAEEICKNIIDDCWNGSYFQTSTGHFNYFWTRDFGWCVEALVKLGYREKCIKTLDYALGIFAKHERITTTITPNKKPFNFPNKYAPESLPYIVYSLVITKAKLVKKYEDFLNQEIKRYLI
jgi:hypothetical protein